MMLEGAKMTRGSTGLFRFIAHATARTSHESWATHYGDQDEPSMCLSM